MNSGNDLGKVQIFPSVSTGNLDGFFDLLQLAKQAPHKTFLRVKKVESNGRVHLKFIPRSSYGELACAQAEDDEQMVRWALRNLIANAVNEVKSHVPAVQLEHVPELLESLLHRQHCLRQDAFSPAGVQHLLAQTGEAISKVANAAIGHSAAERTAPRPPSDCLIDWIAFLSQSSQPLARSLLREAKYCWELGKVNLRNLTILLRRASTRPGGAASLQRKAQSLLAQSAFAQEGEAAVAGFACPFSVEQVPYTQLHDNLYGRVFDSALAAYLLHCPPAGVLQATHDMSLYLADRLATLKKADAKIVVLQLCVDLRCDLRFWAPANSKLAPLLDATNANARRLQLTQILRGKPLDGGDVLLRQSIAVKLMVAMRDISSKSVPWMDRADYSYCAVVRPQRRRLVNAAAQIGTARPTGGITFSYQPAVLPQHWMIPSIRPSEWYKPDFSDPSTSILAALESGMPYVSGLSGSTNLVLHLASHMKKKCGQQIDLSHALLSVLLFVVYDGGHSVHEVMWIGNYLNTVLELDLNFEPGAHPMKYIGSTAQLERLFAGSASAQELRLAKHAAWQKTLQVFHTYSHFATDMNQPQMRSTSDGGQ